MKRKRGLTLIEVLVALAIFAGVAIVLGSAYLNVLYSYELANRAVERNEDLEFVRAIMMSEGDREEVEKGGEFDAGNGRRVAWRVRIEETETPDVYAVQLDCVINSPSLKKPEAIRESLRLLRPTWSKGDERDLLRGKLRERINKLVSMERP